MKIIGQAPLFLDALRLLERVARFDVPLLIEGETGTGKEIVARMVHYQSARRTRPFIPVNCGALPETLIENELFGHERGAFTDARDHAPGAVALAHPGTLFLDEIDALSPKAQVVLLRFLQDQRYRPLGAAADRQADVRIVAATNQDLDERTARGCFRSDLLFRVKVFQVRLPPLRQRPGDATLLAEHFLRENARRFGIPVKRLSRSAQAWLEEYHWPGNVRELENLVLRQSLLSEEDVLNDPAGGSAVDRTPMTSTYVTAKAAALAAFDRRFLRDALTRSGGNITRAAAAAGKDRRAMGRLVKKYGFSSRDFKP